MSVQEKVRMLQESWPPGQAILWGYILGIALYVHNGWFLYYSIVHTYVKGCTGKYAVLHIQYWYNRYMNTICGTHVQYMYIHHMYIYMQCTYMFNQADHDESLPPGQAILWGYILGIALYVHKSWFLYDSIVHAYVNGCTGQYTVAYTCLCNVHTCFKHNT